MVSNTRPALEARRLRAAADDAKARLDALEGQRIAALDACAPGPGPRELAHARRLAEAAEAAAEAATRMARKQGELA